VVRLVDSRVRVQPRVDHDPIDEVVDDDGDGVDASQPLVQRRFRSCAVGHAEHRRPVGAACTLDTVLLSRRSHNLEVYQLSGIVYTPTLSDESRMPNLDGG
jgi:hypothetical protein